MRPVLYLLLLAVAGCSAASQRVPSLAPRAAEGIDPRLPVADTSTSVPADPMLARQLAELVAAAQSAGGRFDAAMTRAEQLAAGAGPQQGESWTVAQQALSVAIAERYPVTRALAEIDALTTARVQGAGQLSLADQQRIQEAAATAAAINDRQASRVSAVQARLGS